MQKLDPSSRQKILDTITACFQSSWSIAPATRALHKSGQPLSYADRETDSSFSEDRSIPPKQFLFERQPLTDVEKVACLAFYLTHYRNIPHFKTLDISK